MAVAHSYCYELLVGFIQPGVQSIYILIVYIPCLSHVACSSQNRNANCKDNV